MLSPILILSTISILSHMTGILKTPQPLHCFFLVNSLLPYKNQSYREVVELLNVKNQSYREVVELLNVTKKEINVHNLSVFDSI